MTDVQKTEAPAEESTAIADVAMPPGLTTEPMGVRAYFHNYVLRVRGGDTGSLPAISGLIVLVVFFLIVESGFGSLNNFANMFREGSGTVFIAMGLVFVLLLGEIDLSAGTTGGMAAGFAAQSIFSRATIISMRSMAALWLSAASRAPFSPCSHSSSK